MLYRLHDETRTVLRLMGADVRPFLQNLVTNDVEKLADGIVYAALLTPQGKYLADFFLSAEEDAVLLDADAAQAPALMQRLSLYKLRADVTIEMTDRPVTLLWGAENLPGLPDPRHSGLGHRLYAASELGTPATPEDYAALRISLCIPAAGAELLPNDSFILEHRFAELNGVDFRKGCYVGQEVTARMKHKTELRKGLVRVTVAGAAEPGTPITTAEGKPAGTLHSVSGTQGLAYLRFDRMTAEMTADKAHVRVTD